VYLADSADFKDGTFSKHCSALTGSGFESPNDTIHVTVTAKQQEKQLHNTMITYRLKSFISLKNEC